MRHLSMALGAAVWIATFVAVMNAYPRAQAPGDQTVYVTKTGAKYHKDGCSSLAKSKIPIMLGDAVKRYSACSICRPPTLSPAPTPRENADPIVYVTRTGPKYHRGTCRSVSQSKIAMKLSEAVKRYSACSVCRPSSGRALESSYDDAAALAPSFVPVVASYR